MSRDEFTRKHVVRKQSNTLPEKPAALPVPAVGRTPTLPEKHDWLVEEVEALRDALAASRGWVRAEPEHRDRLRAMLPGFDKLKAAWAVEDQPASREEVYIAAGIVTTEMNVDAGINRPGVANSLVKRHLIRMHLTTFELFEVVFDLQKRLKFPMTIADVWESKNRVKEDAEQLRADIADKAEIERYAERGAGWDDYCRECEKEREREKAERREMLAKSGLTPRERSYVIEAVGPDWENPDGIDLNRFHTTICCARGMDARLARDEADPPRRKRPRQKEAALDGVRFDAEDAVNGGDDE